MENWKERFRNQFVDTYGEKDSKEWRIAYQPIEELEDFISQELDKAREEGIKEVLSKIKEIFETNIPRGLYSPSETSYLYERFGGAIQQYYIDELSKLKGNK